ncbi:MAG: hypothetical protein Q7J02_01320 [Rhodocyclaceae bacterium]|nr:hypothetical protein [Rhodocyclaceae bacterium]
MPHAGRLVDEAEKQDLEKDAGEFKELTEKIARSLTERVKDVRVSRRRRPVSRLLIFLDSGFRRNDETGVNQPFRFF